MSRHGAEGIKDCSDFFEEYDNRFNPSDVQRNKNMTSEEKYRRRQAVTSMVDVLVGRRDIRAWTARYGTPPPPDFLRRPDPDDARHLSDAQIELFEECFPDGEGGIDYEAFQQCFERFANGELRNPANPGEREPDGGYFFLFAEFAFVAIAEALSGDVWKELLRTFIKCQEIFINTYRPEDPNPDLDDYGPRHFREPQQASDERKRQLRDIYDDADMEELEDRATGVMARAQGLP